MLRAMSTYVGVTERLHPGMLDTVVRGGARTIEHLRAFSKPLGVTMLVENIPNELSTPEKLVELIRTSHFDDVGVCFDFGHAHIDSSIAPDFEIVRDYVRSTHVHDNTRERDN